MLRDRVFNSIDTGIVVIDVVTKKIVDLNTAAVDMIGSSEKDILGSPCDRYLCGGCESGDKCLLNINSNKKYELVSVTNVFLDGRELLVKSFMDSINQKECEDASDEEWSKAEKVLVANIDKLRNGVS